MKENAIKLTIEAVEQDLSTTRIKPIEYKNTGVQILRNLDKDLSEFNESELRITSVAGN